MTPAPPKKPKGALAVLAFGGKADDAAPDSGESLDPAASSFKAVARALGIPPERQAAAQAALHQYIKACSSSSEPDADDEGEGYGGGGL